MPIRIPVDVHLITLYLEENAVERVPIRVGRETQMQARRVVRRRNLANRHTDQGVQQAFEVANQILRPAEIEFVRRSTTPHSVIAPGGQEAVNDSGFFGLAAQFPASGGVSALLVDRFESPHLGGSSVEQMSAMIVAYFGNPQMGKIFAHEFGHLLNLPHPERIPRPHWNLMYPGLRAGDELRTDQIREARRSRLARLFSGN